MTEKIEPGVHQMPDTGTQVTSGAPAPGFGTWEIVDHDGCDGNGLLQSAGRGDRLPPCPACDATVVWQLTHRAPSVAGDHKGVGRLP